MADPPLDSVLAAGVSSQLPEVSREEILRQIFGEVGELIDGKIRSNTTTKLNFVLITV